MSSTVMAVRFTCVWPLHAWTQLSTLQLPFHLPKNHAGSHNDPSLTTIPQRAYTYTRRSLRLAPYTLQLSTITPSSPPTLSTASYHTPYTQSTTHISTRLSSRPTPKCLTTSHFSPNNDRRTSPLLLHAPCPTSTIV